MQSRYVEAMYADRLCTLCSLQFTECIVVAATYLPYYYFIVPTNGAIELQRRGPCTLIVARTLEVLYTASKTRRAIDFFHQSFSLPFMQERAPRDKTEKKTFQGDTLKGNTFSSSTRPRSFLFLPCQCDKDGFHSPIRLSSPCPHLRIYTLNTSICVSGNKLVVVVVE